MTVQMKKFCQTLPTVSKQPLHKYQAFPNRSKPLLHATIVASILALSACSTPTKPEKTAPEVEAVEVTPIEAPAEIVSLNPELERQNALERGDWTEYLRYSNELWQEATSERKIEIEKDVWKHIRLLDNASLQALSQEQEDIAAWAELAFMMQSQGFSQQETRLNLSSFHSDAPFHQYLFDHLVSQLPKAQPPTVIAVMLPESGKYKVIAEFIKNGILKSYFAYPAEKSPIHLRFYDSSDLTNVMQLYYQAKLDGAEYIIGPVQKEAIELLSGLDDPNLLALNTIEQATVFNQFNLRNHSAEMHLLAALESQQYKNLAILASDHPKQQAFAKAFASQWLQDDTHNLVKITYREDELKYREALGKLLNESQSVERKNTLRWIVGKPLDYFPRVRQDLDAILMLDKANRLAVFNPQFDFFQLPVPIYGEEALRVKTLKQAAANPDLNGIRILNPPYALEPSGLTNLFEAFGWDSFLLSTQMHALKNGGCLTAAKTGILSIDNALVDQQLIWTTYSKNGELKPFQFPVEQILPAGEESEVIPQTLNRLTTSTSDTPSEKVNKQELTNAPLATPQP